MLNNVIFILFGRQKEAESPCLLIVIRMWLNYFNSHWSLRICWISHILYVRPSERGWIALLNVNCQNEAELVPFSVIIENLLKNVLYSIFWSSKREWIALLSDSYQNEAELLHLSVVIENNLKYVTYSMFSHQEEAELLYLVLVTRMRLNCLHFQWSLKICWKCIQYVWSSESCWNTLLVSDSDQNETDLPQLTVVIVNMLNNVVFILLGHQKEAKLLCLVIATRMRLNCFNWLFSWKYV